MMNDTQIKAMVIDLISTNDYDHGKQLDKRTAEEPEGVDDALDQLVAVAKRHMAKAMRKAASKAVR